MIFSKHKEITGSGDYWTSDPVFYLLFNIFIDQGSGEGSQEENDDRIEYQAQQIK